MKQGRRTSKTGYYRRLKSGSEFSVEGLLRKVLTGKIFESGIGYGVDRGCEG